MEILKVNLKEHSHNIIIGRGVLKIAGRLIQRLKIGQDAYIITNAPIKSLYGKILKSSLRNRGISVRFKIVADTEKSKSIDTVMAVIKDLGQYDNKKRIFIVALGGGVVGDLAGFVASIYKRGIPYIQIPTTLLAQIDSAIGGKTAIDLKEGKNLVGAFYQPRLILSDISCLKSLNRRQIKTGLAEATKYGIIKDQQLFRFLQAHYNKILNNDERALEFIVLRCSRIKAQIVERDERETSGIRTILNFGHTIGHAIEAASGYARYNHGEAIALGMLCATDISARLGLISKEISKNIEKLIKTLELPIKIKRVSLSSIVKTHYRDKKFIGSRNRFVLIKGNNTTPVIKENIPLGIIKQAIKKRML